MAEIILVRHGISQWDVEKRFIGWQDVSLTPEGHADTRHIGNRILEHRFHIDFVLTSVLERSIVSAWNILDVINRSWVPEVHDWRLNPRHYGVVQGMTYQESLQKIPNIEEIRMSWDQKVPPVDASDPRHPSQDRRYLNISELPGSESLEDVSKRVKSSIEEYITPLLASKKKILIAAHEDSMKMIIRYFAEISRDDTLGMDINLIDPIILDYNQETGKMTAKVLT